MTAVSTTAWAKINLHLQILGRRPDGYHEVRTLLQSIDLGDRVEAEPAGGCELELTVSPEGAVPAGPENLVIRAAEALRRRTGCRRGARIRLDKRVPVGAGLGGGSADAAAALVLLDRVWELRLGRSALLETAAELGSDVPFFLVGGLGLGVGRGDEVIPLQDLPRLAVLVVMPDLQLGSGDVYGRLAPELTWRSPEASVVAFAAGVFEEPCWDRMCNDLQPTVAETWPDVAEAVAVLEATGPLRAAMSGSGAAVFAVFRQPGEAERAAEKVRGRWRAHVGELLPRALATPGARTVVVR